MAKGGTRRVSRRKGQFIWTAILIDQVALSGTTQGFPIVLSADYSLTGSQSEATLMAIRGWFSLSAGNTGSRDTAFMGIVKKDEDESSTGASMDPGIIDFYVNEDVLWTGGWLQSAGWTQVGDRSNYHEILNIKARRKLKTGNDISLQAVQQAGSTAMQISGVMRALLKVG